MKIPSWAMEAADRFLEAGWRISDVLYALDHHPEGSPWQYTPFPYGTHEWVKFRLNAWLDGHGDPLTPRYVVLEEQAQRLRAEQHQRRQERAAALAQASATPLQAAQ